MSRGHVPKGGGNFFRLQQVHTFRIPQPSAFAAALVSSIGVYPGAVQSCTIRLPHKHTSSRTVDNHPRVVPRHIPLFRA